MDDKYIEDSYIKAAIMDAEKNISDVAALTRVDTRVASAKALASISMSLLAIAKIMYAEHKAKTSPAPATSAPKDSGNADT